MVNIGRHGDIKSADKPCLRLAHPERILRNSRAVNANGRGHEHVTQLITSDEETCNKRTVAKCSITAVDIPYNQTADTLARCKYSSESYTQCHCKGSVFETPSHDTYEAYLEILQRDHRTSALRTLPPSLWQPKAINSHSKICISSNRTFTITLFYVLISLLLMCKSSVCLLCSNEDRLNQTSLSFGLSERPSYLGFIDRNKFPKIYSQCKPLTSNFVNDVCDIKLKSTISSRSMELRKLHTNFCGYPLVNVLSSEEIRRVTHCSKGDCLSVLQAVQYMDSELSDMFCQFTDVVNMIDCKEVFATLGNCDKCKMAYRQWLCSVYHPFYDNGKPVKPCIEFCDLVSENCPFFRPFGETLIGEPGFICKDSKSKLAADTAVIYGPPDCCYKPCFVTSGRHDCPPPVCKAPHVGSVLSPDDISTNVTSHSNLTTQLASSANHLVIHSRIVFVLYVSVINALFIKYDVVHKSIGWT